MSIAVDRDQELIGRVIAIADEVAAVHADEVDREARFPAETVAALREAGALSALVPETLGGVGASLRAVAAACFELGRRCSSSAMVFAMHQIQVATMVRHLDDAPWFQEYLGELCAQQRLIASVTSEIGTGGDMGRSIAPLSEAAGGRLHFTKLAPTVSYGAHADDLLTTVRRCEMAEQSDQVLVLSRREQTELEQTGTWDTIGMRGTCSPGFTVRAEIDSGQVLPAPFSDVMNQTHVPISHILWSHVWLGIATEAFERGRAFVRGQAKRAPGQPVPAAAGLSRVMNQLSMLRAEVRSALDEFERASEEPGRGRLGTMATILRFNNLKLAASEQAPLICSAVLELVGIVGFKNDSPFAVGRLLRDSLSARLMVANARIHDVDAGLLLIAKDV
ncbi:MAG: acyl-CoA/acyl-ACP dehydrogenase [Solirubrobacterales bacterium]|nr:acyl-CoA/acyl-ACP dehydrogenase [Solirubrobacterales bacterium]